MIYRRLSPLFPLLCVLFFTVSACEKFSGDQEIPAYLSIDSIGLTTDLYLQGSASHKITDAWVYVDDQFLGAYELPARLPVLAAGKHRITVWSGIKKNGISATRIPYEFYQPVEKQMTLTPDSTLRLGVLKTQYQQKTQFIWREAFEEVSFSLDTTPRSSAWIRFTPAGSPLTLEGSHSGLAMLDTVHDFFECQTREEYDIPLARPVWLEMDFNTDNPLVIGVYSYGNAVVRETPIITLNPTGGNWKKIYIDLTTSLNAYDGMRTFRVFLKALRDKNQENPSILFDNFKLVTRKSA